MKKDTNLELSEMPKFKPLDVLIKKYSDQSPKFKEAYTDEMLRFRLAVEIKSLRNELQLTQKTLAEKADMPQSVIARIEGGKHSISLSTLNKLAKALGKKVSTPFFVAA